MTPAPYTLPTTNSTPIRSQPTTITMSELKTSEPSNHRPHNFSAISKAHVPVAVAEQLTTTARLLVVVMAPFALKVARNCSEWQQPISHIPLLSPLAPMLPLFVALRSIHCAAVATMALFTQDDDIDVASAAIASNSLTLTLTLLRTRWFLKKKQPRSMLWWVLQRWLSFKGKGKRRKGWAGALSKRPRKGLPPL